MNQSAKILPINGQDLQTDDLESRLEALDRAQAIIEFNPDGTVITANANFLSALGYELKEIQGKHHRMFCEKSYTETQEYRDFWAKLGRGEYESKEYLRKTKAGKEIWIQASYNPIFDANRKIVKIVKFASDITALKNAMAEYEGKMAAISKAQAIIEFNLDGSIITANENFLAATEYALHEVQGKHHRMFCTAEFVQSVDYKMFWEKLGRGEFDTNEYKRITKSGKEIWIQASYNPIFNAAGKPYKVVKFATNITEQKKKALEYEAKLNAIDKAQAVIEFNLDGTIITANQNFLKTLGYDISEIKGKHHRMFCDPQYVNTIEYKLFWDKLNQGILDSGEYRRLGKGGKEVWINASYNPVFDASGKPYKVVKFATDITQVKQMIVSIEESATALNAASAKLTAAAEAMLKNAEKTNTDSNEASRSTDEVMQAIQSLAATFEEMAASIAEIARSASESSHMATVTLGKAQDANKAIVQLGSSSEEIGDVIKVISSIAQQTNLLALNATIEAARAGDAGRGFAVVANEVKGLANQTAQATQDITKRIGSIQKETQGAVQTIGSISEAIEKLNQISGQIAAAVEEQSAAANQVAQVVQKSKVDVENISGTIKSVSQGATESTTASQQTLEESKGLAGLSERLTGLISKVKSK